MSRRSKMNRSLVLLSAFTTALGTAAVRPAPAATSTYGARQRTVNAGVLFVGTASTPVASANPNIPSAPDPAPYVFYVLDQRADIKPVGWTFVNPIAPTSITSAIKSRWGTGTYNTTKPVSQDLAAYWEVPLRDVSADQLQQFDVLYLPATGASFTPADNEKLRRFVDSGGQLIVEYAAIGTGQSLFTGTGWAASSGLGLQAPGNSPGPLDLEPILTQPYFFLPSDIAALQAAQPLWQSGGVGAASSEYGNLFNFVLTNGKYPVVTAAQLGAGQIVATSLNLGPVASISSLADFKTAITPGPHLPDPLSVPNATLQMLSNIISWEDAHPTENKTAHQNAAGPSSASFAPSFSYPDPSSGSSLGGANPPPGAAVWGNFIYVTDSTGALHCFDAYPDKDLLGEGKLDNGTIQDFSMGSPYDEIWNVPRATLGAGTSAPTVGAFGNNPYVFVEKANGSVVCFNSITGASYPPGNFTSPSTLGYPQGAILNAPAPTYYEGRVYAGQADGTLVVHDMNSAASASGGAGIAILLDTNTSGNPAPVTASPAVGLLANGDTSNTVVATVATTDNLYTVLLGGRNDPLTPYMVNGELLGYNVNRASLYSLPNLFVDIGSVPAPAAFDSSGGNGLSATNGQDPVFVTNTLHDYGANWDMDFVKSLAGGPGSNLTLNEIKTLSLQAVGGASTVSAPAFDRGGDCYYTVNGPIARNGGGSYLFGVHPGVQQRQVRIKFRFRIPTAGDDVLYADPSATKPPPPAAYWNYKDADGVDYTLLKGFQFVGAPVVDGQGNVYVAASNGSGTAAVLCFNGNQEPSADALAGYDTTQASYDQPDESASGQNNSLIAIPTSNTAAARFGQLSASGNHITVFNFGRIGKQVLSNLSEPQPFVTTPNGNQTGASAFAQNMLFHTNLSWYTTFPVTGQISGLSKAGNVLMLVDSASPNKLYKLAATPTVGTGKLVSALPIIVPLGTISGGNYLSIGTVAAAPSAGGGAMVINGTNGIAAFNQQLTLIADNNRVLEADADGNAVWSADATTRDTGNNTTTKVDFAHPSALTQVAPNDYLVADTGNNRCVRFDRAGKVLWELTRFNDPQGLMAPGQPNTLNQPTSVEINPFPDPVVTPVTYTDAANVQHTTGIRKYYLVADSGNNRLLEIADLLDESGRNILYKDNSGNYNSAGNGISQDHVLTWISHTADQYNRRYRYASAAYAYFPSAAIPTQIAAIVTNTRIAKLAGTALSAAGGDASGGSIVIFKRPATPAAFNPATPNNDLNAVFTSFQVGSGTGAKTYQVRNPRFVNVYTPPPAPSPPIPYSFLYADDNGAFDLGYTAGGVLVSTGLAFTPADYQGMQSPTTQAQTNSTGTPQRAQIPFVPTSVQRINHDNTLQPRYLITQSYGLSELGGPPIPAPAAGQKPTINPRIGGEIFEVDVDQSVSPPIFTSVGGFGPGATLSRPIGTGPLTQPTSAIRTPQ